MVFDDVDVASAAAQLAGAITMNSGQVCCTATRWMIHEKIYNEFVGSVSEVLRKTKIGPGLDPATEMGPLVSKVQQDRVLGYLEKGKAEGATAVLDGGLAEVPGYSGGFDAPSRICSKAPSTMSASARRSSDPPPILQSSATSRRSSRT